MEKDLLHRLIKGEEVAYADIYDRYHARIFVFVQRFTFDEALSQDLTQQAFIRLWERRNRLSEEKPLGGQLFVLTRNLTIDALRKLARERRLYDGYEAKHAQHSEQTEEAVILTDLQEQAEAAISDLPLRRQEIFRLSREKGLTYPEIAQQLGISPKTVEAQMSKALQTLRTKLGAFFTIFL